MNVFISIDQQIEKIQNHTNCNDEIQNHTNCNDENYTNCNTNHVLSLIELPEKDVQLSVSNANLAFFTNTNSI